MLITSGANVFSLQIYLSSWYLHAAAVLMLICNMVALELSFSFWIRWKYFLFLNCLAFYRFQKDAWRNAVDFFPCISNKQNFVLETLCCINNILFLAVSSSFFSVIFNISLAIMFAVFICGKILHFPRGDTLGWSCWFAIPFFKR